MFKAVKKVRRREIRDAIAEADRAVVAATATGAPDRIDDETRGIPISTATTAPTAGTLHQAARLLHLQAARTRVVDAFYHQLCPDCAAMSHAKRDARTDLTGKRALLTGGRAKIGMYIALRLLRDGAHTTITTRFPRDAVRRFTSPARLGRVDRTASASSASTCATRPRSSASPTTSRRQGPLDILINNAAQTVRRSPGAYQPLVDAELAPLPDGPLPELVTFGHTNDAHPLALRALGRRAPDPRRGRGTRRRAHRAGAWPPGSSSLERLAAGTAIDAGGLVPDLHHVNSLDAARRRGRPARDARGAAGQHDGAVPAHLEAARRRWRRPPPGAPTSSTSARWRASSVAATRARATRTPTWPRPRSTCSPARARARCSRPTASS